MADRYDANIDAFWDSRNGHPGPNPVLDIELAATIQQLHTLYASTPPSSTRERARQRVLESTTSSRKETTMPVLAGSMTYPTAGVRGAYASAPTRRHSTRARPKWAWAALAVALLLILGGLGSYFGQSDHRTFFGGAQTTREPDPIPAATVESGWPQFRGGAARTGYTSDSGPGGNLELRWTFTAPGILGNLVSDSTSVYIYGRQGDLYALDAVTGAQRWAVDLSPNGYSDENRWPIPAVADGIVYVGTYDGNMLALDTKDGSVIWQRALSTQPVVASPLVLDGLLYQIAPDGAIVQLERATGDTVWEWTGDTTLSNWAPAAGDGLIFVPDEGGDLVAVDTATGTTKWTASLNDVRRNPAYADGVVYIGGDSLSYYALDANDGSVIWKTEPGVGDQTLNPVVTPDALIVSYENGPMEARDRATGSVLWSVDGPGSSLLPMRVRWRSIAYRPIRARWWPTI